MLEAGKQKLCDVIQVSLSVTNNILLFYYLYIYIYIYYIIFMIKKFNECYSLDII